MNNGKADRKLITTIIICVLSLVTVGVIIWSIKTRVNNWWNGWKNAWNDASVETSYESTTGSFDTNDAFDSIDVNVDIAEVTICKGTEYKVSYEYKNVGIRNYKPTVSVADGKLRITQKVVSSGISLGTKNGYCNITITVPSDVVLSDTKVVIDIGNLNIRNVAFDSIDGQLDVGEINADDIKANKVTIGTNVGEIEISNSSFEKGRFTADVGTITLNSISAESVSANANIGDIVLELNSDSKDADIDLVCDIGSVSVNGRSMGKSYHSIR